MSRAKIKTEPTIINKKGIKERWLEFLEEDNGRLSNVRLMSFVMLFVTIFLAVASAWLTISYEILLICAVVTFVPKTLQKIVENRKLK